MRCLYPLRFDGFFGKKQTLLCVHGEPAAGLLMGKPRL
ncbi:hypothetical protein HMPREF1051_0673 [Neisseria sicca VK64]|uniref:Uncharacterized protein n=1 Tax=Neisseria sicca VK64 TaxID=1095748 RepID=I2NX77_NEISI|nr:hypothetical protein HMPREF1051_0673 [Neisseria sicca VK64]